MTNIINNDERKERITMIKDSAASVIPAGNDMARIRSLRFTEKGMDSDTWKKICEMGWIGLSITESEGGIGLGMGEYVALLEVLGAGLLPEPIIDAIFVASLLPKNHLKDQLSGDRLILPAGFNYEKKTAVKLVSGKLHGQVNYVSLANAADAFLVYTDQGVVLVENKGLSILIEQTQDGGCVGTITFNGEAPEEVINVSAHRIQESLDAAALGTSAYLLGVMENALDQTLEYMKIRKQFGKAIGSFQALQHRAVDLKIQVELSRAIINQAASEIDEGQDVQASQKSISTAKIRATNAAFLVTRQSIQLHGAIGYTDESNIGLFLRKTMVWMSRYGSVDFHQQRYIDLAYGKG